MINALTVLESIEVSGCGQLRCSCERSGTEYASHIDAARTTTQGCERECCIPMVPVFGVSIPGTGVDTTQRSWTLYHGSVGIAHGQCE